jgi:hypothetical protein
MKLSLGLTPRDYSVAGGASYDADAQAYFTANTSITSAADKNAINTFYLGLKSDGIYTKIKAMYLPIWGSAASCKWNLVNPLDSDAAFRLTFSTGWTFSSSGMTPVIAYANTQLNCTILTTNSVHISTYVRTNQINNAVPIGATNNTSFLQMNISTSIGYYYYSGSLLTELSSSLADSKGFFVSTTSANNNRKTFRNGVQQQLLTSAINTSYPNLNIWLGSRNYNNSASTSTDQEISFSSIGDGLTDTEANNFYTRVNTLMTYFGINV